MSTISPSSNITTTAVPSVPFVEADVSRILRIILFSLTTLAALLGNTVVCKAVCELPCKRKPLSYLLVINLAVAEIISTACLPFVFVSEYLGEWLFGQSGCTLIIPLQVASMFVVTSTLAVIAVYRYYFIVVQPVNGISPRAVKAILVLLWVIPFLFCLPVFLYHKLFLLESGKYKCYPIFPGDDVGSEKMGNISNAYHIARFIFNFIAPCLVMVLAYTAVTCKLKRHVRRTREMSVELTQVRQVAATAENPESPQSEAYLLPVGNATQEDQQVGSSRIIDLEHDLVRMFYLLIVVFLVFYIPYQVFFMYLHFGGPWPSDYVYLYLDLLANFPSALHPLCYGTISIFYAKSFNRLVLCKK